MLQDQLDLLNRMSGVILREASEILFSNRSLKYSVGFCRRGTSTLRASAVGVSSCFGEMFDKEMVQTREALSVADTESVAEISDNGAQVSTEVADLILRFLSSAPGSCH